MSLKILSYVVLVAVVLHLQEPQLNWVKFQPPEYPRNAQLAHIQGKVILEFALQVGNAISLQHTSGHPMLIKAAQDSLQMSRLSCENCAEQNALFTVIYDFEVVNHDCNDPDRHTQVTRESRTHIRVVAQSVCTVDPVVRYVKTRSFPCLYLWRCGRRPD